MDVFTCNDEQRPTENCSYKEWGECFYKHPCALMHLPVMTNRDPLKTVVVGMGRVFLQTPLCIDAFTCNDEQRPTENCSSRNGVSVFTNTPLH
jgi:hypothetical protein